MAAGWNGETALGGKAQDLALGRSQNEELEIFYIGTGSNLYRNRQVSKGSTTWTGETPFKGDSAKHICVAANQTGELEIFYIGENNDLYHNRQSTPNSDTWSGEQSFGVTNASFVTAIQNASGALQIFYIAKGEYGVNHLFTQWQQTPGSTNWQGGNALDFSYSGSNLLEPSSVVATVNKNKQIQLFLLDGSSIWSAVLPGAGVPLPEVALIDSGTQCSVAPNQNGLLELFYCGNNKKLFHVRETVPGAWGQTTEFDGAQAKEVVAVLNGANRLEIFYRGAGDDLYHNWQLALNGTGWQGETSFDGNQATSLAIGHNFDGRLEMVYAGEGDDLYHNWQTDVPDPNPVTKL